MPATDDYYTLLGVSPSATEDEIKRAYRKLARELHPDTNPDPVAEDRFKQITVAYETLRDPERRRRYDMFGPEAVRGSGAAADPFGGFGTTGLGDLFDAFFGGSSPFGGGRGGPGTSRTGTGRAGPLRGEDGEAILDLEFAEAVFGVDKELTVRLPLTCLTCEGSGARKGTTPTTCSSCGGSGEIRRVRQSILGQMVTAGPCPRCGGTGEEIASPCPDCHGDGRRTEDRSFIVEVPAGVDDGSTLRLPGRGTTGPRGGPAGDLYVHLRVRLHPLFTRHGADLHRELHLAMTQAALGANLVLETLDGDEELNIAPGTQSGHVVRLRGRGVPHIQGRGRGDLLISVMVDVPTELSKSQEELLRLLADERGEPVTPVETGLFSKIRGAFK